MRRTAAVSNVNGLMMNFDVVPLLTRPSRLHDRGRPGHAGQHVDGEHRQRQQDQVQLRTQVLIGVR